MDARRAGTPAAAPVAPATQPDAGERPAVRVIATGRVEAGGGPGGLLPATDKGRTWLLVGGDDTEGAGWIITSGTFVDEHYYLAEWRNYDGFDKGLRYAYDTTHLNAEGAEWRVTRTPYNAPGMLVWYRDAQYTVNHVTVAADTPVPRVHRGPGGLVHDLLQRPRPAGRRAPLHRRQGLVPGARAARRGPVLPRRGRLGGGPVKDQRRYTTRIVDADGNPLTDLYGTDLGDGIILGTGNPADGNPLDTPVEDLSLGVEFTVRRVAGGNRWVVIRVNAADAENAP